MLLKKVFAGTRVFLPGGGAGTRVARTLATNYGTYDRLVKGRILHRSNHPNCTRQTAADHRQPAN